MSISESLVRRKAALRAEQRRKRGAVAAQLGAAAAEAVARRIVTELQLPPGAIVSGYWPLMGEFDPRPAMHRLAGLGHPLALPRVQGLGRPLAFHAWQPGDRLRAGPFQVLGPRPDAPLVNSDMLLVPLLAFDRSGRRLGYGAGYYEMCSGICARGARRRSRSVSRSPPRKSIKVPTGARDQMLDAVVTERHVHHFSGLATAGLAAGRA